MAPKLKNDVEEPKPPVEGEEDPPEGDTPKEKTDSEQKLEAAEKENVELKKKNKELEDRTAAPAPVPAAPVVTADDLESLNEEEQEKLAETYKMPFKTIVSRVRSQEKSVATAKDHKSQARTNVREAIEDLADRDPQAAKLKKGIREYFDDLPASITSDPEEVSRRMKKAITYAKGAAGTPAPRKRENPEPNPGGPGEEPEFEDKDKIKAGEYEMAGMKIKIEDMPESLAKKIAHPSRREGVQIPTGFDQEPQFK